MEPEGYDLKWRNHTSEVFGVLKRLRLKEAFTDVILYSREGRQFRAHKVILASCSIFFENMLEGLPNGKSEVLIMTDTCTNMLDLVMQFIYVGEVFVNLENIKEFMDTAEKLGIRGLKRKDEERAAGEVKETRSEMNGVQGKRKRSRSPSADPDTSDAEVENAVEESVPVEKRGRTVADAANRPATAGKKLHSYLSTMASSLPPGVTIRKIVNSGKAAGKGDGAEGRSVVKDVRQASVGSSGGPDVKSLATVSIKTPEGSVVQEVVQIVEEGGLQGGMKSESHDGDYEIVDDFELTPEVEDSMIVEGDDDDADTDEAYPVYEDSEPPQNLPPGISPSTLEKVGETSWKGFLGTTPMYFCTLCSYKVPARSRILAHESKHTGIAPFQCPFCEKSITRKTNLRRHIYSAHGIKDYPL